MAVIAVNVGPKRVMLTAYCPDDALGIAACDYVLAKVKDVIGTGVSVTELRAYLTEQDAEWEKVFKMMDDGWEMPTNRPFTVDPRNIACELQIVEHMIHELTLQGRSPSDYALNRQR